MSKQKKPVHRVKMTEGKRNIIHQLLEEYDIQTAEDIQDARKDFLGGTIKEMTAVISIEPPKDVRNNVGIIGILYNAMKQNVV